ncbi:alpha/beta hydrolase [Robertkochia solimangrovi]|uniref:alpha/beta hydrolase n=1 Tax=Robertkochia solimangrovi TaxID=2213046 RepID=UPI00117EF4F3|nr:hypothetical protein [Robertkochia solimangrovi]TRZ41827.1 hypothetical protein DMZ48_15895 [Robertkochia solimangrovi]
MKSLKQVFILFILSGSLMLNQTFAQDDVPNKDTTLWSRSEAYTPTRVNLPDNYDPDKPYTLVIGLHGYGSSAEGFLALSKPFTDAGFIFAAPEAYYPVPLDNGKLGYEWFLYDISSLIMLERPASDLEKAAMRVTTEKQMGQVISDLKTNYRIDKVFVAGFSQGGIITYLTGIHHYDKIDGMIIFSSVVDTDWLGNDDIREGNRVRTLIIQGEQDTLVPIALAENGRDLLLENGYEVTYRKFEGKHSIPMHLMDFVIEWIKEE